PGDKNAHAVAEACAKAMWLDDHASKGLGMSLQRIAPGEAVLSMTVRKDMTNGHGICHGGFIFTLADSTFAFACNTYDQR
ncbi:hotdog fold thioesterase, partial [Enterococcus faecium]|uniref:hotdog fold thioesterase n=1 Tax=Enterococcus faecium TaxID=1352 RepID=UPI003F51C639